MEHSEDRLYEAEVKEKIEAWKAEKPGVVAKGVHYLLAPVGWLVRQVVPEKAITALLHAADWAAEQTIPAASETTPNTRLSEIDRQAAEVQNWAIGYGVAEGAAGGYFGILSVPVDIPAIIMLALRTVRRVGACYGYTDNTDDERHFVFGVLAAAGANTEEEKVIALYSLSALQRMIATTTFKKMAEIAATKQVSKEGAVITARTLAKQVGLNLTKRRLLGAIPVISSVISGSMNGWYISDVGVAARHAYQERWLKDRGLLIDAEKITYLQSPNKSV